jgi:putative transposase
MNGACVDDSFPTDADRGGRETGRKGTNLVLCYFIANAVYSNMLKVVKVRLYPDVQQQQSLAQAFGSCRWLWNYCLNLMN